MRIEDAKKAYSAHLDTLREKKNTLTGLLKENESAIGSSPDFDRVEISRELSEIDKEYEAAQKVMDDILKTENIIYTTTSAIQQGEAAAEGAQELGKVLAIYRRIASGAKVPSRDEQKLMEFSHELYFAAKAAAMLNQDEDKEYDSLWKDEKRSTEPEKDPEEVASDAQIAVPTPQQLSNMISND